MDLTESIAPRSDQQNYDDYLTGPRTVTISAVTAGSAEQPFNIELVEYPGRPYKPNKSMRRVLVIAWGAESKVYVGRQMKLVGNPAVLWGGKAVGGIEIAALSHIDGAVTIPLTVTRGRRKDFTVKPLVHSAPENVHTRDWLTELDLAGNNLDAIASLGTAAKTAHAPELGSIVARYNQILADEHAS